MKEKPNIGKRDSGSQRAKIIAGIFAESA